MSAPDDPGMTPAEEVALGALHHMLNGRVGALLNAASPETKASDAPAILKALLAADETVIHQPPTAAQEALAITRNPNSSTDQVVRLFEKDPALTQALLSRANSAFYKRGESCASIRQAVQRIGGRGVESVVTTTMVESMLCKPGSAYQAQLTESWGHMTRTAPIARDLALVFMVEPEVAFTLGLLHDLGKLVTLDHLSQLRAKLRREVKMSPSSLQGMLDRLHEPLGGIALIRWQLGDEAALAVASHQRTPPPEVSDPLGELLYVANLAEHTMRRHGNVDLRQLIRDGELTVDPEGLSEALKAAGVPVQDNKLPGEGGDSPIPRAA